MTKTEELGEFEGRSVSSIKIIITKTGDGLSKAMEVEPMVIHQGDVGYIVLSYVANKIRFDPVKGDDELFEVDRVQILEATGATFIDRDLIGDAVEVMLERIEEHEAQIKREKDIAKGIFTFDDVEAELAAEAALGEIRAGVPDDEGASEDASL